MSYYYLVGLCGAPVAHARRPESRRVVRAASNVSRRQHDRRTTQSRDSAMVMIIIKYTNDMPSGLLAQPRTVLENRTYCNADGRRVDTQSWLVHA